ncbi:sorbitol dehydrogenase [Dothidotthia symphoricarpi CBS 119687]|uniref:Sorbitol dehydrogenase n=1 Tax=Dothidotthia symphoricarpi CBS 119687 TaxID=1392245 RepID=A0A6A6AJE0_9PLEO|nr:sorbitol dehydrogenase [Dothidotthia symphoricarpi CBS 119687]KAF2130997.1 sorbitol dehydrogenase [Dothidotthia symphoricarpi CBS 119687]
MNAVRFHGQHDLRYEKIPVPEVKPGQVKIRPAFVGICGSDLHEYLGGPGLCPTTPHPITGESVPVTFGHEFSGIVEEVGEGVAEYKTGDRVVVQPIIYDGTCGACEEGLQNCCWSNGFVGLSGWGGGLADHIVLPTSTLYHLPDNVPLEIGALVEPLAVGWHAVKLSPYKPGNAVLILGGGPIGISTILALKAKGCEKIIVSEVSRRRQEFAKKFGADYIINPLTEDLVARCRELTDGRGVHIVFDCAGVQAALDQAVHATRARGCIVNIAIWEKPCTITPNDFNFKERTYIGVATYEVGDFQEVIDALAAGSMEPSSMITQRIKLTEVEEKGFKALINDKDNQVKILVEVGGGD